MTHTFKSNLSKKELFKRIRKLNIRGVLVLKERCKNGEKEIPTGFIVDDVGVVLFTTTRDRVWVGLNYGKGTNKTAEEIIKHLELQQSEAYPLVVDNPSKDVMSIWGEIK